MRREHEREGIEIMDCKKRYVKLLVVHAAEKCQRVPEFIYLSEKATKRGNNKRHVLEKVTLKRYEKGLTKQSHIVEIIFLRAKK